MQHAGQTCDYVLLHDARMSSPTGSLDGSLIHKGLVCVPCREHIIMRITVPRLQCKGSV